MHLLLQCKKKKGLSHTRSKRGKQRGRLNSGPPANTSGQNKMLSETTRTHSPAPNAGLSRQNGVTATCGTMEKQRGKAHAQSSHNDAQKVTKMSRVCECRY